VAVRAPGALVGQGTAGFSLQLLLPNIQPGLPPRFLNQPALVVIIVKLFHQMFI